VTTSPPPERPGYLRTLARPPRSAALRIAAIYAVFGLLWICFSDLLIETVFSPEIRHHFHIQTIKGFAFILVTAGMLYALVRSALTAVQGSEQARRTTEEQTRMVVEHVRDYAIFLLDAAGNVTSWNRGAQQITDWTEQEVIGKHFSVFYPKADIDHGKPGEDLECAAREDWCEEEGLRVRQDGSSFWARWQITSLHDAGGAITGFLAVIRDVTERRRVQDALQQSVATLSGMIEAMPLPAIAIDRQKQVIGWNPAAQKMFGWTAEELMGKTLPTVPPEQQAHYQSLLEEQWSGQRTSGVEVIRQRKDGTQMQLSLWTAALLEPDGSIGGSLGIFADLSDRKRAEEQVRQLNDTLERRVKDRTARLEEANEELQAFSYTVSHDLRIPLRSLQQLARDLLDHHGAQLDEEATTDALRIVGAAARMEQQIDDLLEFSRVSRSELATEPLSLILVVYELLGRLQRDPEFRDAQVSVQEPLGWVMGHRLTLQQVILNLLTNAITFVAAGVRPEVLISAKENGEMMQLFIADNGIGIREEDRERVFQLFERLPAAERYPGMGVGLAVVRRGVERMGGKVEVELGRHGGTVFRIDLPKAHGRGGSERTR